MALYLAKNNASENIGTAYVVEGGVTVPLSSAYSVESGVTSENMLENNVLYKKGGSASLFDFPPLINENDYNNYSANDYLDATFGNVTREKTSEGIHLSHEFLGTSVPTTSSSYSHPAVSVHTIKAIDVTKYNTLNMEVENFTIDFLNTWCGGYLWLGLANNLPQGKMNTDYTIKKRSSFNANRSSVGKNNVTYDKKVISLDVSTLTGSYYVYVENNMETRNGHKEKWDFYITKIWLE